MQTIVASCPPCLQALPSGFEINSKAFGLEALNAAKLFVKLYTWYPMPASVHKILTHGPQILENALLPISQLPEKAQESPNK